MTTFQKAILLLIVLIAAFFRFYYLSSNPPGLYWDEAVFGYDAYSVLKTKNDHHGNFLPLFFESYGDWKLPAYHYLLIPSIAAFNLNEFAVRFPSALLGTLTVPLFFLLVIKLTKNINLGLFTAFFLAVSPWTIQFSRGGFESTAGLFFVTLATYLFLRATESKKTFLFVISGAFFVLSIYSYHAYRIFTPLFIVSLFLIFKKSITPLISKIIPALIICAVLILPIAYFTLTPNGVLRATSQSSFRSQDLEAKRLEYDQKSKRPLRFLSKYLYTKPVYYLTVATTGYLDHFSPVFLFSKGDQIGRHSQVDMGQIYGFEAILVFAAVFALKKQEKNVLKLFLAWLFLAPVAASIVSPTPHAYRTLQMAMPIAFFSGLGAYYIFSKKGLLVFKIILIVMIFYSFITYTHLLFSHYPKKFGADWQDGYKQMVEKIVKYQQNFDKVYITDINQVPYIYLLFYQKYDSYKFLQENGGRDHFGKYYFVTTATNVYDKGKILYVAPSWQKVDGKWLDAVNDTTGRHLYSLWEIGGQN